MTFELLNRKRRHHSRLRLTPRRFATAAFANSAVILGGKTNEAQQPTPYASVFNSNDNSFTQLQYVLRCSLLSPKPINHAPSLLAYPLALNFAGVSVPTRSAIESR